jgi:putative ABC transport system permease protein
MVVAGLLTRFLIEQRTHDLGYEIDNVLTLRLDLPEGKYAEEHRWQPFFDAVLERVESLPEVEAAGLIASRPLAEGAGGDSFVIEDQPLPDAENLPFATVNIATQGAVDLLRLPVVRGRGFDDTDSADGMPVVLVNEDMVRRYWAGASPLGSRIRFGGLDSEEPWRTVVGVVGDMFSGDLENPSFPMALLPLRQNARRGLGLMVRTGGEPAAVVSEIRRQVWAVDADQPLGDVRTLRQIAADSFATADALISLFLFFAAFALLMASTGIYGVLSFSVARRSQEIGIRMALGARGNDVMRMIGRQALWLVGIGIAIGSVGALLLGRIVAGVTPGMSANDPWTLAVVALVLFAAAMLAVYVPARRAVRIDPAVALRKE